MVLLSKWFEICILSGKSNLKLKLKSTTTTSIINVILFVVVLLVYVRDSSVFTAIYFYIAESLVSANVIIHLPKPSFIIK